jgi:hypothetical protein
VNQFVHSGCEAGLADTFGLSGYNPAQNPPSVRRGFASSMVSGTFAHIECKNSAFHTQSENKLGVWNAQAPQRAATTTITPRIAITSGCILEENIT